MTESVTHLVVGRLAVERCQNYLAHLYALMHLCEPGDLGLDPPLADSVRQLMGSLSTDLSLTARMLRGPEEKDTKPARRALLTPQRNISI